ncbi:hypothetical protein [Candidatus Nitrosotenuis chungbukensis]|uniref:hypothetical protein n=2 Tax=Candidatus Nitrosotenuis chungbukensis TaxID=1353246 RepID=UPI0005B2E0B1|nr:hypothetical protein [Candidatus Nitrosotenuis chungbukensis]
MWKLDREDDFFRIFDKNHNIAGYFVPDYGNIFPEDKADEVIEQMHKNRDKVPGGYLTVPMVKFGIFGSEEDMDVMYVESHLSDALLRLEAWKEFLLQNQMHHAIRLSHTDQDMLSLTFPVKFTDPVSLEKTAILGTLEPTLDLLHEKGLL